MNFGVSCLTPSLDPWQPPVSLLPSDASADSHSDPAGYRRPPLPSGFLLPWAGGFQRGVRPGLRCHSCHTHHRPGWGCGHPQAGERFGILHAHTQQRRPVWTTHRWWVKKDALILHCEYMVFLLCVRKSCILAPRFCFKIPSDLFPYDNNLQAPKI